MYLVYILMFRHPTRLKNGTEIETENRKPGSSSPAWNEKGKGWYSTSSCREVHLPIGMSRKGLVFHLVCRARNRPFSIKVSSRSREPCIIVILSTHFSSVLSQQLAISV